MGKSVKQKDRPVSETKLNRFLDQVEKKYLGKNPIKKFLSWYRFVGFCDETMKQSPSVGVLWFFSDFIKLAERVYFYNNSQDSMIYSHNKYEIGSNGFTINDKSNNIILVIEINSDFQQVTIEIKRKSMLKSTILRFTDGSWGNDRQNYDEVLVDNIIGIINSHIVALMWYCWDRKGNFDNIDKRITN